MSVPLYAPVYLSDTHPPSCVYTALSLINIISLINVLTVPANNDVAMVVFPVAMTVLSLCLSVFLLVGILKSIPVLMVPAMIVMVCASSCCAGCSVWNIALSATAI